MSEYRLYYAGFDAATGIEQIGLAVSEDLVTWRRPQKEPIVPVSSTGIADAVQTSNPCVLLAEDGFRMWYQGRNPRGQISICYASSRDGLHWQFRSEPVMAMAPDVTGNRVGYHHPHVLFDPNRGTYRMWCTRYRDDTSCFVSAESADGISWTVRDEYMLAPARPWEGRLIFYPCILREGERYEAWYSGLISKKHWQIGRAVSSDGIAWSRQPDRPILPVALPSSLTRFAHEQLARFGVYTRTGLSAFGAASPNVWKEGGTYHMLTHDVGARGKLSIGHYVSENGVSWVQIGWDILSDGRNHWESFFQGDPFLIRV